MSETVVKEDPNKILKCFFDSDFFKKDPETAKKFKISIDRMFNHYYQFYYVIQGLEDSYKALDPKYLKKLPFDPKDKIEKVEHALMKNQEYFTKLGSLYSEKFDYIKVPDEEYYKVNGFDDTAIGDYFFNSLLRDWTDEFNNERERNYSKILSEIQKYYDFTDPKFNKKEIKILVPGTGCSRMAFELAKRGFTLEVNDICYVYIFSCDYLFNYSHKGEFEFYPRAYDFNNSFSAESSLKKYVFPNVNIKEELQKVGAPQINFIKGDFISKYKEKKDLFDCIVTIFFIDVADNIIELVEIMHDILKKGGIWVNLGTLDYYSWETCDSIDLCWDELRQVIMNSGFDLKKEETGFTPYGTKEGCTVSYLHGTVCFTAMKK